MTLAHTDSLMAVHAAERARRRATTAVVVAAALALAPLPFVVSTSAALVASAVLAVAALASLAWLALAHGSERLAVLDAIAAGADDPSLPAVARARERLVDPRHRARLADGLRAHADAGRRGALPPGSRRVVRPRTAAEVADELEDLAALVVAEPPARVRGLAACELLLIDGVSSPLFATDASVVRQELARIGALLGPAADA